MNKEVLFDKIKEYRFAVVGLVLVLLLGGGYMVRKAPIPRLITAQNDLERDLIRLNNNQRASGSLPENLESIKFWTENMESRLISQNLADIHDIFYKLERQTGVTLIGGVRVSEGDSKPIKPRGVDGVVYKPREVVVMVSGSFKNVLKFLRHLEAGDHIYRYGSILVSSSKQAEDGPQINLTITMELLSRHEV